MTEAHALQCSTSQGFFDVVLTCKSAAHCNVQKYCMLITFSNLMTAVRQARTTRNLVVAVMVVMFVAIESWPQPQEALKDHFVANESVSE